LENQFFLPDLPPEFRASPPPQRQRRIPLHPTGQNWNHAVDKGKAVITHVPSATVAPPQTLATGINQQLPMGEAMNLNLSPQQLQAYETLLALGILDGSSPPDPVTLDHLMECLDLQTPLHFPEPSPVNALVNPTRTPLPLSSPTLPLTQPHPPIRSTPPPPSSPPPTQPPPPPHQSSPPYPCPTPSHTMLPPDSRHGRVPVPELRHRGTPACRAHSEAPSAPDRPPPPRLRASPPPSPAQSGTGDWNPPPEHAHQICADPEDSPPASQRC
jgi:hypothetical protein